jgi:hypothetical protein
VSGKMRHETQLERLDRNFEELTGELRVVSLPAYRFSLRFSWSCRLTAGSCTSAILSAPCISW